jgi:AcrR family transcriptional regulator
VPNRAKPLVSTRKEPRQARSGDLMAAVLDAAVQVLRSEGATRFTTARVAERAGVSVGSLYQYFPNKAAILFRLQADEWRRTSGLLRDILTDAATPPLQRLRAAVHAFVRSECEEASVRTALADAAPLYRDAEEALTAREGASGVVAGLVAEALPCRDVGARALVADLIETTLTQVGARFSETDRSDDEIHAYADALADMLCGYLRQLGCRP